MSNLMAALFNAFAAGLCLSLATYQFEFNTTCFIALIFVALNIGGVIWNVKLINKEVIDES